MVTEYQPSGAWREVTRREPCTVCEGDHWCEIADDGTAHCMRVDNGGPAWDKRQGGWLHRPSGPRSIGPASTAPARLTPTPRAESADDATKHAVYTRLVELCPLSRADRDYLRDQCGHTDEMIAASGYATIPPQADQARLMTALVGEFGADTLRTVPGVVDVRHGHLRWRCPGLVIPVHDRQGRIRACRVRVPLANDDKSYFWLSSTRAGGPGSGAPAHVARPPTVRDHRVYVCESEKTANYLAHTLGATDVALAGQNNHGSALQVLAALRDEEGAEVAVLLFDAVDPTDKQAERKERDTEEQRQKLAAAVACLGYAVRIGRWAHADGKGPDDLLINGHTFSREVYTLPVDESGGRGSLGALATRTGDEEMVSVEPRFLAWLITRAAAAATLGARYHYVLAVAGDKALNDGQKLTEIALFARLPLRRPGTPTEPVTVAAATIARDLGSEVTRQKDGSLRPTKQNTVTKNLADLINLGVRTRDEVVTERIITVPNKRDKEGPPIQQTITTTSYAYHGSGSLPGQRMKRDEARAKATGARIDRERPRRCPSCYSDTLKPSAHVCLKCGRESSDVEATRAGQEIIDLGDGRFRHRDTDEIIVPGVAVVPAEEFETQYRNPVLAPDEAGLVDEDPDGIQYRIPVTIDHSEHGYRNPVLGPTPRPGNDEADHATRDADSGRRPWSEEFVREIVDAMDRRLAWATKDAEAAPLAVDYAAIDVAWAAEDAAALGRAIRATEGDYRARLVPARSDTPSAGPADERVYS